MNAVALLDVNVLVALAWPNHVHHVAAHEWFAKAQRRGWATCPATQSGFVRVSANPKFVPDAKRAGEALGLLRALTGLSGHEFWIDDVVLAEAGAFAMDRLVGHRQVSDLYLVLLAIRHGGRLATFDRGVLELVPPGEKPDRVVELLQA